MSAVGPAGLFITLEGGEGAGKSTLAQDLKARVERLGRRVVLTREPGGSPFAERLREVLLSGAAAPLGPFAETLLFAAARDDHLASTIRPALARGAVVICDRFADSTRAYQGVLGGVAPELIDALERIVVGDSRPDLTLILDVDPTLGLARARRRSGTTDRFERESEAFHRRLRQAYRDIAKAEPGRCALIDANRPPDFVAAQAWKVVCERLDLTGEREPA